MKKYQTIKFVTMIVKEFTLMMVEKEVHVSSYKVQTARYNMEQGDTLTELCVAWFQGVAIS